MVSPSGEVDQWKEPDVCRCPACSPGEIQHEAHAMVQDLLPIVERVLAQRALTQSTEGLAHGAESRLLREVTETIEL
jgi:hypothetical protein